MSRDEILNIELSLRTLLEYPSSVVSGMELLEQNGSLVFPVFYPFQGGVAPIEQTKEPISCVSYLSYKSNYIGGECRCFCFGFDPAKKPLADAVEEFKEHLTAR
jgi:hypothetical protein